MRKIVILGATSGIAMAAAREFAERGDELLLVGRNGERLESLRKDLQARATAKVECLQAELADCGRHEEILAAIDARLPGWDTVLAAYGVLGDQAAAQRSFAAAEEILRVNFLSLVALLTPIANRMEERRAGTIVVLSSVAGDRGRRGNYVYGAAKGALSVFLQGLRHRLSRAGVQVLTVKPGFVDTPMTAGMKKGPLFAQPEEVARAIVRAIDGKRAEIYTPWFWRPIMCIIKHIPEPLFQKLNI